MCRSIDSCLCEFKPKSMMWLRLRSAETSLRALPCRSAVIALTDSKQFYIVPIPVYGHTTTKQAMSQALLLSALLECQPKPGSAAPQYPNRMESKTRERHALQLCPLLAKHVKSPFCQVREHPGSVLTQRAELLRLPDVPWPGPCDPALITHPSQPTRTAALFPAQLRPGCTGTLTPTLSWTQQ